MDWSDDLMTGVEVVDDQHKEIIERLTKLLEASEANQEELIDEAIDFLADYIFIHFNCEERLQISSEYPDYEAHKQEHENFTSRFIALRSAYTRLRDSEESKKALLDFAAEWLLHHIKVTDMAFATYYKSHNE